MMARCREERVCKGGEGICLGSVMMIDRVGGMAGAGEGKVGCMWRHSGRAGVGNGVGRPKLYCGWKMTRVVGARNVPIGRAACQ